MKQIKICTCVKKTKSFFDFYKSGLIYTTPYGLHEKIDESKSQGNNLLYMIPQTLKNQSKGILILRSNIKLTNYLSIKEKNKYINIINYIKS
jgi:hypothetical protein